MATLADLPPNVAARFGELVDGVWDGRVDPALLERCRRRVCELVGAPVPNGLDGASLVPVLEDPTVDVKDGALSMARGYLWRTEAWAYMRYEDGSEELYDMRADPQQIHNLASSPEHQAVRKGLAAALDRRLQRSRSP